MNVLGVQFDTKLSWSDQVNKTINKAKKAFHAINILKKHFTNEELKGLLTSSYYSILYYNSEIWHLPTLSPQLKQKLLSASSNALKLCLSQLPLNTSFESIHRQTHKKSYANPNVRIQACYNSTNSSIQQICLMTGYLSIFSKTSMAEVKRSRYSMSPITK